MWEKMRVGEIGIGFKEDEKNENRAERKMNETF